MEKEITNQISNEFFEDLKRLGESDIEYRFKRSLIKHSAMQNKIVIEILEGLVTDVDNLLGENDIEWQQAGYFNEAKEFLKSRSEVETSTCGYCDSEFSKGTGGNYGEYGEVCTNCYIGLS